MNYKPYWNKHPLQRRAFSLLMLILFPVTAIIIAAAILLENHSYFTDVFAELWISLNDSGKGE